MRIEEIITTGSQYFTPESPESRTSRFDLIVPALLQELKGNIVEIGAGEGHSTKVFLQHAKENKRQVLVVDPWETVNSELPGYNQYTYRNFVERTAGFTNLTVCKKPSHDREVPRVMERMRPFAFAFVDGIQLMHTVLSDLFLCSANEVQVICVDDFNRETEISQVPKAVRKFVEGNNKYRLIEPRENQIECYLIKSY